MNLVELFTFIQKIDLVEIKTPDGKIIFKYEDVNLSTDKKYVGEVDIK